MQQPSILVATDFSEHCDQVLTKAFALANSKGLKLNIVHVVEDSIFKFEDKPEKIKANCIKFLMKNFPQIELNRFYFKVGNIEDEIEKLANEIKASMLVIGNSGENFSFEKLIMGSTTKKIIRTLDIPTLVIKNNKIIDYKYILVPTDFTDESKKSIEDSFKLFPEGRINLLHVYSVPFGNRLNMYGIDDTNAKQYVSNIASQNLEEGYNFIDRFIDNKKKLTLTIENDVLTSEYFTEVNSDLLDGVDLISLHTTGNISFFTFEMLERSDKDVLIIRK